MTYLIKYLSQTKYMVTGINESNTLTKHKSCECKCTFDGIKCNLDQWWNNDKCQCECKKHHICEKDYVYV